jgi:hypothetical protein
VGDFGLRVSLRLQNSPLWKLSPRALRLWVYLAMKSNHAPQTLPIFDGYRDAHRVKVGTGQWLTSTRALMKDASYRSAKAVIADLRELRNAGVISTEEIRPRFQNGSTGDSKTETPPWFQNGSARNVLATLVTVHGLALSMAPVSKMETKEVRASPVSAKDRREREQAFRILAAEGR